jgi:peptide subunit release factor 1 (eRF1)
MISRQDVERLADFRAANHSAISFYYVPVAPQDRSHRQESILIKDLIRGESRSKRAAASVRADLERIHWRANELREVSVPKAIFACHERGVWEEFDVPWTNVNSVIQVGRQFHIKPLVAAIEDSESVCIALIDRGVNRLFRMQHGSLVEDRFPEQGNGGRKARTVGTGYSSKFERSVENGVTLHYKTLANHLMFLYERGEFNLFILGGREEMLPMFLQYLPSPVHQVLIGTLHCDPGLAELPAIKAKAQELIEERRLSERNGLVRELTGEAKRNARGAMGLAKVLQALERGEVQQLVLSKDFAVKGTLCPNCEHLDSRMLDHCPVCATHMLEQDDISDVMVARAYRSKAGVVVVDGSEFAGRVGALLRFRADQNTPKKLAS